MGSGMRLPKPVLVDARNHLHLMPGILETVLTKSQLLGFDIETEDSGRHEGLNRYMKVDDDGVKAGNRPLVFDINRTNITGFSLYPDGHDTVWYFNLMHADAENRLPFEVVEPIFDLYSGYMVAHNASFEKMMTRAAWGKILKKMICTLQLSVTAYGDDEYPIEKFYSLDTKAFEPLAGDIIRHFASFHEITEELSPMQGEILKKVVGKESRAAHSYNGWVDPITYGHGLKDAVKSWFGYQMKTFEETLGGKPHMGCLTGDEVVSYGCDDAFWAVQLYHALMGYVQRTNPQVVPTFFNQENPMVDVYARTNFTGIRANYPDIAKRKEAEYASSAPVLQELRAALRDMRDNGRWFQPEINAAYAEKDSWYGKKDKAGRTGGEKTRAKINAWVNLDDAADAYEEVARVNGGLATSWREEMGEGSRDGILNLTHYFVVRTLLYDLCGIKPVIGRDKKVMSDADIQQVLMEKYGEDSDVGRIIKLLKKLSSVDQRMKLYITPYSLLTDPETKRMYPVLSCKLNTRRMATSFPNPMQLPKIGEGSYVRGFFLADPGHLIVSHDWSQIELVRVAELSRDPEMLKCYQQRPYADLHTIAVEAVMQYEDGFLNVLKKLPKDLTEYNGIKFEDNRGNKLDAGGFVKWLRRDVGKVSNFNYWYSGALAAMGEILGWEADRMWEATDRYRSKFCVGEEWRVDVQKFGEAYGFVQLWDGHRRVRFERTPAWREAFLKKFDLMPDNIQNFWKLAARKIYRRSGNQMVNALIQGDCATLAKRTILRAEEHFAREIEKGWCRFMLPVHDEVLHSVAPEFVPEFLERMRPLMLSHEDMFQNLVLDCSASVGVSYEPYDPVKAPFGQIELNEAPGVDWIPAQFHGKTVDAATLDNIVQYLAAIERSLKV